MPDENKAIAERQRKILEQWTVSNSSPPFPHDMQMDFIKKHADSRSRRTKEVLAEMLGAKPGRARKKKS